MIKEEEVNEYKSQENKQTKNGISKKSKNQKI